MGNYLSSPNLIKVTQDGRLAHIHYAVCAMQGWRVTMEDSHIVHLFEYLPPPADGPSALFGIYDGHGGPHVAQFVARHLIDELLKSPELYLGNFGSAFRYAYISLDTLLRQESTQAELQWFNRIRTLRPNDYTRINSASDVSTPYPPVRLVTPAEHTMKLHQELLNCNHGKREKQIKRSKKVNFGVKAGGRLLNTNGKHVRPRNRFKFHFNEESETLVDDERLNIHNSDLDNDDPLAHESIKIIKDLSDRELSDSRESTGDIVGEENDTDEKMTNSVDHDLHTLNRVHEMPTSSTKDVQSDTKQDNYCFASPKGTGSFIKNKDRKKKNMEKKLSHRKSVNDKVIVSDSNTDQTCGNHADVTYMHDVSSSKSNDNHISSLFSHIRSVFSHLIRIGNSTLRGQAMRSEGLAMLAGCTANSALITTTQIIVANTGDSRAVLCRGTSAVELSRDHKPNLSEEKARIYTAGGWLEMGRVNGNLNLSRAVGDLLYKTSPHLPPEKQIVSVVPDIVLVDIQENDEFLIIGCDGIWESSSSQEVVNFVLNRIETNQLGDILENLFEELLSPNPSLYEFGCDNMTAILIDLNPDRRQTKLAQSTSKTASD